MTVAVAKTVTVTVVVAIVVIVVVVTVVVIRVAVPAINSSENTVGAVAMTGQSGDNKSRKGGELEH